MRRKGRGWEAEDTAAREEAESGVSGERAGGGLGIGQGLGLGFWTPVTPSLESHKRQDPRLGRGVPSPDAPSLLCQAMLGLLR